MNPTAIMVDTDFTFELSTVMRRIGIVHKMFKKAIVLTRPPLRAKTRISPNKAAASEEARRTLRYVEPLSEARTMLEDFFNILLGE